MTRAAQETSAMVQVSCACVTAITTRRRLETGDRESLSISRPAYLGDKSSWLTPSTAADDTPMNAVLRTTKSTARDLLQLTYPVSTVNVPDNKNPIYTMQSTHNYPPEARFTDSHKIMLRPFSVLRQNYGIYLIHRTSYDRLFLSLIHI